MKAVATALILIAGAAVVLWYGNTLNSWVLGGLIGGLAALLLSIPISLTLFSYLSRRHDERLQDESQEVSLSQVADYADHPRIAARAARDAYREHYVVEEYTPAEEQFWDDQEEEDIRATYEARNLPGSQAYPRQVPRRLPAPQQRGNYVPEVRQQQKALPPPRATEATPKRNTAKRVQYPGFPGYTPGSTTSLSQYRTAALRAARQEAVQHYEEEQEMSPSNVSRRMPSVHPGLSTTGSRPVRRNGASRSGRMVDATSSQSGPRRELPSGHRDVGHQLPAPAEPETEYLYEQYPHTTGQLARRPHLEEQPQNPDVVTGSLKNPLVRRAPYMYEDDPIRQEMSQQINNAPITRRSSRNLYDDYDE